VERVGSIAVLQLDRPEKLNALNLPMLQDIRDGFEHLDQSDANGVVITGSGRAFSAGDDLPATESLREGDFKELLDSFQGLTRAVLSSSTPVVAALNGISVGGAAEFTLCCDARIGFSGSDYLFPENNVGLTISNASTYLLPRIIGSHALPLVLDGRRIDGTEAHRLGLIDYFVDSPEEVVPRAIEVVRRWSERGLATRFHLRMLRPSMEEIEAAIARENAIGTQAWKSGTAEEGISRFLDERAKRHKGG
jgi:enoyl-CoA hydratase/carnithine racemase